MVYSSNSNSNRCLHRYPMIARIKDGVPGEWNNSTYVIPSHACERGVWRFLISDDNEDGHSLTLPQIKLVTSGYAIVPAAQLEEMQRELQRYRSRVTPARLVVPPGGTSQ